MIHWHDEWTNGYKEEVLLGSWADLTLSLQIKITAQWNVRGRHYFLFMTQDGRTICSDHCNFKSIRTAKKAAIHLVKRKIKEIRDRHKSELREMELALSSIERRSQRK